MIQFVKIIERFPDIYDHNLETYRRYTADKAWDKVVETVKAEMSMECTRKFPHFFYKLRTNRSYFIIRVYKYLSSFQDDP